MLKNKRTVNKVEEDFCAASVIVAPTIKSAYSKKEAGPYLVGFFLFKLPVVSFFLMMFRGLKR